MTRRYPVSRVIGLAVAALLLPSCSAGVQDAADKQAGGYAHGNLRQKLESGLDGVRGSHARAVEAEKLLSGGPGSLAPDPLFWWATGSRRGSTIPVVVYFQWGETSLSSPAWGRACQDIVISDQVEVRSTECPDGTPVSPGLDAVTPST